MPFTKLRDEVVKSAFSPGNMDDFMAAVGMKNEELKKRSDVVQDIFAQQETEAAQILTAQQSQADNSQIVLQAKQIADLDAQNKVQTQATRMGINPGVSSEVLDKISDEWKASKLDSIDKRKHLKDALEVKFFEHPIDYISAQFHMEDTVNEAEAATARSKEAGANMAEIQSLTQQLPGQMAALSATRSAATVQATMEGSRALLDEKLARQKIENGGIQVQRLAALSTMDSQQLSNLNTAMNMQNQKAQLGISQQHLALAQKQFTETSKMNAAALEDRLIKLEEHKDDRQQLEDAANMVRQGAAAYGFKNVTAFPTSKIVTMLNSKQANIVDFYRAGMQSQATGKPIISDDIGQTVRSVVQHGAPLMPEQASMKTFLQDVYSETQTPQAAAAGGYNPAKPEEFVRGARIVALKKAAGEMSNIKFGDNTNIYAPPPLPTVLETKAVKDSKWYGTVMAVQAQAGGLKEVNPDQLITMTAQAVKDGKLSHADAVSGLQHVFTSAVAINNATKNYEGMGLPPQTSFNTKTKNGFGVDQKVNLLAPQDIGKLISGKLSGFQSAVKSTVDFDSPFPTN